MYKKLSSKAIITLLVILIVTSGTAYAAPGDTLRQITGAYSQPCTINTGLGFDGTNLIMSCYYHGVLDFLSPADGSLVGTVSVAGYNRFGAMAWDATRNKLWICGGPAVNQVVLVDTSTGVGTYMFTASGTCLDGLAYDGTDDTIWTSGDVSNTLYHYKTDGTLIGTQSMSGKIGRCGNSGIAVGGTYLFLANNGCSEIYQATKTLSSSSLFATFDRRLEDMECDGSTFPGVGAMWSQDAYDRIINAYEIPANLCGSGGLPPTTSTTTTTTSSTTTTTGPPPGQEIPEYPTTVLPVGIAALGYLMIRRRKQG